MNSARLLPFRLVTATVLVPTFLLGIGADLLPSDPVSAVAQENTEKVLLTGIWKGTFVTEDDVESNGYLDVTERKDGTLTGNWGNSPRSVLTIKQGKRVKPDTFQWEATSIVNDVAGRYRVRATRKGNTLDLDVTYTWRVNGKMRRLTAVSTLMKK